MKKFGTPMWAGPGVASEKLGLVGAGEPSGLLSAGAGGIAASFVGAVESLAHSRPEVEVELPAGPVRRAPVLAAGGGPVPARVGVAPLACFPPLFRALGA